MANNNNSYFSQNGLQNTPKLLVDFIYRVQEILLYALRAISWPKNSLTGNIIKNS